MFQEFKKFIARGNVMDMAVGVIMGSAFTAIVNSLVNDMFMPVISLLTGGLDFSAMKIPLGQGEEAAAFNYGSFIAAVINFLLIAIVVFCVVKLLNKMNDMAKKNQAEEEAKEEEKTTKECPYCCTEISIHATRCPHCTSELERTESEC